MKLPFSMLTDFVATSLNAEGVGDLLTMAGFELEGIEEIGGEPVLEIKVMANRGDGLSALGLAREILAKDAHASPTSLYESACNRFGTDQLSKVSPSKTASGGGGSVLIDSWDCNRYAYRTATGIKNPESPKWLQDRLEQAGLRPISLLVDLTNYVMLELGQPLHVFDLDKLSGSKIVVRHAKEGEKITTINGKEHELSIFHMMICDAEKPIAVAGVMGGSETEVTFETTNILIESAHFDNRSIRKTRKSLGLNTDSSYRFERSVDPDGVTAAIQRLTDLYTQITGIVLGNPIVDAYANSPEIEKVTVRLDRARKLLGVDFNDEDALRYLKALGIKTNPMPGDHHHLVTPPSWRADIKLEEDVIEEIARIHGYDNIPETQPVGAVTQGGYLGLYQVIFTAKKTMLRAGLDQMISHSLRNVHPLDFNPLRRVKVRNPHSPEMAYLRSSLLPGLAEAALRNGGQNFRIFELGKVFVKGDYQNDESPELAIMISGDVRETHWAQKSITKSDFWTLKGIIEELGHLVRDDVSFALPRLPDHRFHPTRQAGIMVDQGRLWVGTMGQIHPDLALELGLPEDTFMAELDLLVFFQNPNQELQVKHVSRNPAARRDIAFTISKSVTYTDIENAISQAAGVVLERQMLFDVYEGKGIEPGEHSLAVNLQLRKMGGNFTDEEANDIRDKVVASISELGGKLR